LIGDVFLLSAYGEFSALVDLAFMLLVMAEFYDIKDFVA